MDNLLNLRIPPSYDNQSLVRLRGSLPGGDLESLVGILGTSKRRPSQTTLLYSPGRGLDDSDQRNYPERHHQQHRHHKNHLAALGLRAGAESCREDRVRRQPEPVEEAAALDQSHGGCRTSQKSG